MANIRRMLIPGACIVGAGLLSACGFHLRRNAALPEPMQQQVYLNVTGGGELPRELARALNARKIKVLEDAAPGVAELDVSGAFSTDILSSTGFKRVGEYAVRYHVDFSLKDATGMVVVPKQGIDMSHEFTFDPYEAIGTAAQVEVIQRDLVREMSDTIMRRLEAIGRRGTLVAPASGEPGSSVPVTSSSAPAAASSSH